MRRTARMTTEAAARSPKECPLAAALADALRQSRTELVRHWLDRITARVSIDANRVFPTDALLDHVPLLIDGIADYLENSDAEVSADTPVVGKALELGELRHRQGFDAYQIMKEYEILGGILFNYLAEAADGMPEPCEKSELLVCGHRLFRAITIIQQTTTTQFLRLSDAKVAEREDRLRAFNRLLSHEIKNHIGAIVGASDILDTVPELDDQQRKRFIGIVRDNGRAMKERVESLVSLSRLDADVRQHRHIGLPEAAAEASRQVREAAQAANVAIRISPSLPNVEVNTAVVELALTNYLTNSIKYAVPGAKDSYAEISGQEAVAEVIVCVKDNGLGVPPDKRAGLFERFFRAHQTVTGAEGTGLGLSIVKDMVESVGGRAWAEFPDEGSTFFFALPLRRSNVEDRRSG